MGARKRLDQMTRTEPCSVPFPLPPNPPSKGRGMYRYALKGAL